MITLIAYFLLQHYAGNDWNGWLLVLPVFTDLILLEKLDNYTSIKNRED